MPDPVGYAFLAATVLSALGVGLSWFLARRIALLDHPDARASHTRATPTGGGLGLVLALAGVILLPGLAGRWPPAWSLGVLPGMVLLAAVGWIDDRRGLDWRVRLIVQVLVSLLPLWFFLAPGLESSPPVWVAAGAVLLFLVGMMNAFNFMDGSNGMAGGQALFAGATLTWLFLAIGEYGWAMASAALAGAALGFLPWNFPLARIFMGDAGSVALGFGLACLVLVATLTGAAPGLLGLLVLGLFLVDAGLTLAGRLIRGERWYTAHRKHLYQRLLRHGWSHTAVFALYMAINFLALGPVVVAAARYPTGAWWITGIVFALLGAAWLVISRILGEQDGK